MEILLIEIIDGEVFLIPAYRMEVINFATQKCLLPQWHQIFLRAIGANWLVCFAVFISISSREVSSKILAIWWPTMTFVALGLDHVIVSDLSESFLPCPKIILRYKTCLGCIDTWDQPPTSNVALADHMLTPISRRLTCTSSPSLSSTATRISEWAFTSGNQ